MPDGGYPKDDLGLQVPATVKKRPSHQFAIHDPIFSAFLGELGALAVKLSSMIRRCGPHRPTGFKNRSLPSPHLAFEASVWRLIKCDDAIEIFAAACRDGELLANVTRGRGWLGRACFDENVGIVGKCRGRKIARALD